MKNSDVVNKASLEMEARFKGESTGHDWGHMYRVWKLAKHIAEKEKADLFVVELAALLHDIADWKFNKGDEDAGPKAAREWLEKEGVDKKVTEHVCEIIKDLSFKGVGIKTPMKTIEGLVVQDADRLEAIGAIGIARAFATGAKFGEVMHSPEIEVPKYSSAEEYKQAIGTAGRTTINHFYEKLLFLKDRMNTATGKKLAQRRHKFMEAYLKEFFAEWEGKV